MELLAVDFVQGVRHASLTWDLRVPAARGCAMAWLLVVRAVPVRVACELGLAAGLVAYLRSRESLAAMALRRGLVAGAPQPGLVIIGCWRRAMWLAQGWHYRDGPAECWQWRVGACLGRVLGEGT